MDRRCARGLVPAVSDDSGFLRPREGNVGRLGVYKAAHLINVTGARGSIAGTLIEEHLSGHDLRDPAVLIAARYAAPVLLTAGHHKLAAPVTVRCRESQHGTKISRVVDGLPAFGTRALCGQCCCQLTIHLKASITAQVGVKAKQTHGHHDSNTGGETQSSQHVASLGVWPSAPVRGAQQRGEKRW